MRWEPKGENSDAMYCPELVEDEEDFAMLVKILAKGCNLNYLKIDNFAYEFVD